MLCKSLKPRQPELSLMARDAVVARLLVLSGNDKESFLWVLDVLWPTWDPTLKSQIHTSASRCITACGFAPLGRGVQALHRHRRFLRQAAAFARRMAEE
jgi:hypothetical protein